MPARLLQLLQGKLQQKNIKLPAICQQTFAIQISPEIFYSNYSGQIEYKSFLIKFVTSLPNISRLRKGGESSLFFV
jgi:hypothetical protein